MAPSYTFTGEYPRIMTGLIEGVNAEVTPAEGRPALVLGQTVVLETGDSLVSSEEYPHPELKEIPAPEPAPAVAPAVAPAPVEPPAPGTVPAQPAPVPSN